MKKALIVVCLVTVAVFSLAQNGLNTRTPASDPADDLHKPIIVEVHHASELAEITLKGMKSIPKIVTAAEFVGNTLSAYKVFRAAGKGARFGGTVVGKFAGKVSPAGPFVTAWFAANAPLDVAHHNLDKRVAHAALNEAIGKAKRLLALNSGHITIVYDGKRYEPAEVIEYFESMRDQLNTADPTWGASVKEAVKAAVPVPFLFENDTAEREMNSASAQLLLAQAIQDLIAAAAPEIIEKASVNTYAETLKYWSDNGEELRRRYFDGLACNIYVTCKQADLEWEKHKVEVHAKKVSLPIKAWTPREDPTGELRFRAMSLMLSQSTNAERYNWGCVKSELFGPIGRKDEMQAANNRRVFSVRDDAKFLYEGKEFSPDSRDTRDAIYQACREVKDWDGRFYVQYSSYLIQGLEPFRAYYGEKVGDVRSLTMNFVMADPKVPETMAKMMSDRRRYREFLPQVPEPPQMRAR